MTYKGPPTILAEVDRLTSPRSASWGRWAGRIFVVLGIGFLVHGIHTSLRAPARALPDPDTILVALGLSVVWLTCSARSWTVLFEGSVPGGPLARAYYSALLGRYIPGGIWHPVGQIGFSHRVGVARPRAAGYFLVQTLIQAVVGAVVGSGLALFVPSSEDWVRLVPVLGILAVPLLHRRWLIAVAVRVVAAFGTGVEIARYIPSQAAILRSAGWATAGLIASGAAFAALAVGVAPELELSIPALVTAFAFVWTVGFLCVPVPAGLGIREAVLTLVFPGAGALMILVSVTHRAVGAVTELAVLALALALRGEAHPGATISSRLRRGPSRERDQTGPEFALVERSLEQAEGDGTDPGGERERVARLEESAGLGGTQLGRNG